MRAAIKCKSFVDENLCFWAESEHVSKFVGIKQMYRWNLGLKDLCMDAGRKQDNDEDTRKPHCGGFDEFGDESRVRAFFKLNFYGVRSFSVVQLLYAIDN